MKRRWDDDVVFKNQARGTEDRRGKEFVNVSLALYYLHSMILIWHAGSVAIGLPQEIHGELYAWNNDESTNSCSRNTSAKPVSDKRTHFLQQSTRRLLSILESSIDPNSYQMQHRGGSNSHVSTQIEKQHKHMLPNTAQEESPTTSERVNG